jgi:hypothetical protein
MRRIVLGVSLGAAGGIGECLSVIGWTADMSSPHCLRQMHQMQIVAARGAIFSK